MKSLSTIIVAVMVIFSLAACSDAGEQRTGEGEQGSAAPVAEASTVSLPSLNLQDVNGNMVALEQFRGKKVFVNLWASWCPPCKREMPSIQKLYQSVDSSKAAFVLLSLDEQFDKAKDYISSANLQLPVYYPAGNLPALFNVESIPTTFIFDEKGALIKRVDGSEDYDTEAFRAMLK